MDNQKAYSMRENAAMLADIFSTNSQAALFKSTFVDKLEGHAGYVGVIVGLSKALDDYEEANAGMYDGGCDWYEATENIVNEFYLESINTGVLADPAKVVARSIM